MPRSFIELAAALTVSVSSVMVAAIRPEPATSPPPPSLADLSGITRRSGTCCLIENHSTAFNIWHAAGIRAATLVHVDAHDDCRHVPDEKLAALQQLLAARNYQEIFRQSDIESSFRYKIQPDRFLFDLGNFIYPCIMDGTVTNVYWVIPDKDLQPARKTQLQTHLRLALKLPAAPVTDRPAGGFSITLSNGTVTVTTLAALPTLAPGALLDLDTDFFVFENVLSETHITGRPAWNPPAVCTTLQARVPQPAAITICSSISGGYLPVQYRFLTDACFEYFSTGIYPAYAETFLAAVTTLRSLPFTPPTVPPPDNRIFQPAYEHLRGLIAVVNGDDRTGIDAIATAATLNSAYSKGLLDLAEAFICLGRIQLAREMIDRYDAFAGCETLPSTAMKIRVYIAENESGKAEILTDQLLAWDRTPYALIFKGGILLTQGRIDQAISIYSEAIRLHPDNAALYYNMGIALEKQGNIAECTRYYRKALAIKADLALAHENLGYVLLRGNEIDAAISHLKSAATLNPFNSVTLNNLALALAKQNRYAESLTCYSAAKRLTPERAEIHANMAAALLAAGMPADAIAECKIALKLRPDWPEVRNLMKQAENKQPSP